MASGLLAQQGQVLQTLAQILKAVSGVLAGQNPTLHGTYFSKLPCPPPSHLKKKLQSVKDYKEICNWVLSFKVHRGPQQLQLLFSRGRSKALNHTRDLTTRDGVLSGFLTGPPNTSNPQVPTAGPGRGLGD